MGKVVTSSLMINGFWTISWRKKTHKREMKNKKKHKIVEKNPIKYD